MKNKIHKKASFEMHWSWASLVLVCFVLLASMVIIGKFGGKVFAKGDEVSKGIPPLACAKDFYQTPPQGAVDTTNPPDGYYDNSFTAGDKLVSCEGYNPLIKAS